MSGHLAAVRATDAWPVAPPVYRSIVAVDLEGSTRRSNPVKGELRRILYELLDLALEIAGIGADHREELIDRGDGVLILIRPHDEVPKTVLLGRLIPMLAGLLAEHNAVVTQPELKLRLRAVVHAGEVHEDARGFYGDDLDVAFRLLDAPAVKRALRDALCSPLVLVVSEEIFTAVVRHGYVGAGGYRPAVRVRVGERNHRGRVHIPVPISTARPATILPAEGRFPPITPLVIPAATGHGQDRPSGRPVAAGYGLDRLAGRTALAAVSRCGLDPPSGRPALAAVNGHAGPRPVPG